MQFTHTLKQEERSQLIQDWIPLEKQLELTRTRIERNLGSQADLSYEAYVLPLEGCVWSSLVLSSLAKNQKWKFKPQPKSSLLMWIDTRLTVKVERP